MAKRGYRISVDDNIRFLEDIAAHPEYTSLFDNPFLKMFREFHEKYGTKIHFNLFFERGNFNLTMVPDRFRDEWAQNADWIHLSFHSKAEFPNWPYRDASPEEVAADCRQVHDEILRFAGPEVLSETTTLHFAAATPDGVRALRDCGVKILLGDFSFNTEGKRWLHYYCTDDQFDLVREKCFVKDSDTDMIFCCCDIVLDCFTPETVGPELDRMAALWPDRDFVDLLIHEQYFYPDYHNHRPFYRELVETGINWCRNAGYEPVLVADIVDPDHFDGAAF